MRRAKSSPGISPKLLRHFAAATLAITFCIAIFADANTGETEKPPAKRPTRDQAQVNLIGATRLANNNLKVKPAQPMPDEDQQWNDQDPGNAPQSSSIGTVSGTMTVLPPLASQTSRPEDLLPARQAAMRARKKMPPRQPSDAELAGLLEASRARSGASSVE